MEESVERSDIARLIGLTDAALAITLTLLMLDIRLPKPAGELDNAGLLQAILALWPSYFAYALSFVVIGASWLSHRRKFREIIHADAVVTWLNIIFLLFLGLNPFVTSIIAENDGAVATIAYAAVVAVDSLILTLMWLYAAQAGYLATKPPAREKWRKLARMLTTPIVLVLSMPIALFNPTYAKLFWLVLVLPGLLRRLGILRSGAPPSGG